MRRLARSAHAFGMNFQYIQLAVLVLAVGAKVLADGNSLLDEHVEVFGDLRSEA
jgi:hypothetical protein